MAIQSETGVAAAKVSVDSVGIAHRNCGDPGTFMGDQAMLSIADGAILRLQFLDLQNLHFQRGDRLQTHFRQSADPIYSHPKTHHVMLETRETLDSRGV